MSRPRYGCTRVPRWRVVQRYLTNQHRERRQDRCADDVATINRSPQNHQRNPAHHPADQIEAELDCGCEKCSLSNQEKCEQPKCGCRSLATSFVYSKL